MVKSQKSRAIVLIYYKFEEIRISVGAVIVVVCVGVDFHLLRINLLLHVPRLQTLAQCTNILVGTSFCLSSEFPLLCVLPISIDSCDGD